MGDGGEMRLSEKQLEDFVCKHPEYSIWNGVEIIGRQIRVEHGIIDILAWDGNGNSTLVIELKTRPLEERDIGQVLRYDHDVSAELGRIGICTEPINLLERGTNLTEDERRFTRKWNYLHIAGDGDPRDAPAIIPILIGPSISQKVKAACEAVPIAVRLFYYDKVENTLSFDFCDDVGWGRNTDDDSNFAKWTKQINQRIYQVCMEQMRNG